MSKIYIGSEQIAKSEDLQDKQDKLVSTVNIKTVQGNNILGEGDLHVERVDLADNLFSADSQIDSSEFIVRTAGGEASIETGEATLVKIDGHSTSPTHTPEVLTNSYTNVGKPIFTFNEDTWLITGSNDIDYTTTYTYLGMTLGWEAWQFVSTSGGNGYDSPENMAVHGIVVTGDVQIGDEIVISYTTSDNHAVATFTTSYSSAGMNFDKDTWRSYVNTDGTYVFTYDGADWKLGGGLSSLTINQSIQNGDKIYFDTTKGSQLATFISSLTYGSPPVYQLLDTNGHEFSIWSMKNDSDYVLMLVIAENNVIPIYATGTGSVDIGMGEPVSYVEGWQNLTNGYYTLSGMEIEDSEYIEYIDDTTSSTWNGVFFGNGTTPTTVDLSNYGITIIGTEHSNDYITIVYSKVDYGTISSTTPTKFISIGFNLFDYTTGFARVVGNTDGQWYIVRGNYTSIEFSTSKTGTFTPITPSNYTVGSYTTDKGFPIYQNGWIKVTGGDDTTTMVNLIWSGYMMTADYQEYHEDYINIPTEDANGISLPTELRSVGTYSDELNFSLATWTVNIGRIAYTAENLSTLLESNPTWLEGVQYEWDNDYIYYLLDTPTVYTLSSLTSGIYDVDDFGIEEFQGTTIPAEGNILYGQNLVRKLTRDVLIIGQQTLTTEQKQQVWSNLGLEILGDQQF